MSWMPTALVRVGNWMTLCLTPPMRLLDLTRFPMCLRRIRTAHTAWINWQGAKDPADPDGLYGQRIFTVARGTDRFLTLSPHMRNPDKTDDRGGILDGVWEKEGRHKLIPVAKSTELLFVNETGWKQFRSATGLSDDVLNTWEGLVSAAEEYYRWSGGQPLLGMNSFNDFAVLTAVQDGADPFPADGENHSFVYSRETARKAWNAYYVPHINGWYKSSVYNQDGLKSGSLLAYIGSSAGAGYFPKEVIVDGENQYPIECGVRPYPTFEGGSGYMAQRGADMGIFRSSETSEYAAAEFLKWFTDPERNIEFTASIGYIPVENEALSSIEALENFIQMSDNTDAVKKSVTAALEAMQEGKFYVRRPFENSYEANERFSRSLERKVELDMNELHNRVENGEDRQTVISGFMEDENFDKWYQDLMREMVGEVNE